MYSSLAPDSRPRQEAAAWHALALTKLQQHQKSWDTLQQEFMLDDPELLQEGASRPDSSSASDRAGKTMSRREDRPAKL